MRTVLVFCALISASYAYGSPESYDSYEYEYMRCPIEGVEIDEDDYEIVYENDEIFDDHEGPLLKLKRGSITEVIRDEYDYYSDGAVEASIKGDEIVFEFTEEYKKYDFDYETTTGRGRLNLRSAYTFKCAEGETYMVYIQPVVDINNNAPRFNRKLYTYKFGMDVASGFELTQLTEIFAADLDWTDETLAFSVESNDYLDIKNADIYTSHDNIRKKLHYAVLTLKKAISGKFDETFKIYAKDKNEEHTAEAEVRLVRV